MKAKVFYFIIMFFISFLACQGISNNKVQGKESFSKEDSLFLQTFIIHKTNMPTKLLFDRQIYKIAKNTNNENFLNKRNTKINISERIINNQKV